MTTPEGFARWLRDWPGLLDRLGRMAPAPMTPTGKTPLEDTAEHDDPVEAELSDAPRP